MIYHVLARAWRDYNPNSKPSSEVEAIIEVPGDDTNHARGVAFNSLDKFAREADPDYRKSVDQALFVRPATDEEASVKRANTAVKR